MSPCGVESHLPDDRIEHSMVFVLVVLLAGEASTPLFVLH